jgi:hypothetical protein
MSLCSFVEYLQDDGPLVLPDTANPTNATFKNEDSDDSDSEQWNARPEDPDPVGGACPVFVSCVSRACLVLGVFSVCAWFGRSVGSSNGVGA